MHQTITAPKNYRLKLYSTPNMLDNADYIAYKTRPIVSDKRQLMVLVQPLPHTSTPHESTNDTIRQFSKFSESRHVDTPSRRHPILYVLSSSQIPLFRTSEALRRTFISFWIYNTTLFRQRPQKVKYEVITILLNIFNYHIIHPYVPPMF